MTRVHATGRSATLSRAFALTLLFVHVGLGMWAFVGYTELVVRDVVWEEISNPLFTTEMLLVQWTLVSLASVTFLGGYLRRWSWTRIAMLSIYGAMALTCAYQTFFILTSPMRYVAMTVEYIAYLAILIFLFRSQEMRARFRQG